MKLKPPECFVAAIGLLVFSILAIIFHRPEVAHPGTPGKSDEFRIPAKTPAAKRSTPRTHTAARAAGPDDFPYTYGPGHRMKLRPDRIAMRVGTKADLAAIEALGFHAGDLTDLTSIGWVLASTKHVRENVAPASDTGEALIRALIEYLGGDEGITFTSPIFESIDGILLTPAPRILFCAKDDAAAPDVDEVLGSVIGVREHRLVGPEDRPTVIAELDARDGFQVLDTANELHARAGIEFATPGFVGKVRLSSPPTEPTFGTHHWQHHYVGNVEGISQTYTMNTLYAWSFGIGSPLIKVLIMDSGIDPAHPDLNHLPGHDFLPQLSSDGSPKTAFDNHGTNVAGMAGAVSNGVGAVGAAPGVSVISARCVVETGPETGYIDAAGVVEALYWAQSQGVRVTVSSWDWTHDPAMEMAFTNTAYNGDMVHFSSAGNNDEAVISPPASYDEVAAVGAAGPDGQRFSDPSWFGSNYGPELDFLAPGVYLPTTDRTGSDGSSPDDYNPSFNATSAAAPLAAGVAALILSRSPMLDIWEVRQIMWRTCTGPKTNETGKGLINAFAAVGNAVPDLAFSGSFTPTVNLASGGDIVEIEGGHLANHHAAPFGPARFKIFLLPQGSTVPSLADVPVAYSVNDLHSNFIPEGETQAVSPDFLLPHWIEPGTYDIFIGVEQTSTLHPGIADPGFPAEVYFGNNVTAVGQSLEIISSDLAVEPVIHVAVPGPSVQSSEVIKYLTIGVTPQTIHRGGKVTVTGAVGNRGSVIAPEYDIAFVLKRPFNPIDPSSFQVESVVDIAHYHPLPVGQIRTFSREFTIPASTLLGPWQVEFWIDLPNGRIGEESEANNTAVAGTIDVTELWLGIDGNDVPAVRPEDEMASEESASGAPPAARTDDASDEYEALPSNGQGESAITRFSLDPRVGTGSLRFNSTPGSSYSILASSNFEDWTIIHTTNGSSGATTTASLIDPKAGAAHSRFYQVRKEHNASLPDGIPDDIPEDVLIGLDRELAGKPPITGR